MAVTPIKEGQSLTSECCAKLNVKTARCLAASEYGYGQEDSRIKKRQSIVRIRKERQKRDRRRTMYSVRRNQNRRRPCVRLRVLRVNEDPERPRQTIWVS